jgi:hypothetical protein
MHTNCIFICISGKISPGKGERKGSDVTERKRRVKDGEDIPISQAYLISALLLLGLKGLKMPNLDLS